MSRWEGFEELVKVVEVGSFSGAARSLGVSKGHVSQRISQLEERLGARLLHRTTRKLSLTELGNLYYERCRQVVDELDEIESAVTQFQQKPTGLLKISSPNLLGEIQIVPAIADFVQKHSALEVALNFYSRKVDLVEDGYDIAIQVGKRDDISVINRVIAKTRFQLVASPRFLNQNGSPGDPDDLRRLRCLQFTEYGVSKPWRFQKEGKDKTVRGHGVWQSNSGHCLLAAARAGVGIAYLPDYYLADELKEGRLIPILVDWCAVERDIVAIYQQRRHMTAKVKLFVDFIEQRFNVARPW